MNDWVNCLNTKLRDLKILSPKENIYYSKPPLAMKSILQMTRNPRDPLPLTPALADTIPGLELLQTTRIEAQSVSTTTAISEQIHNSYDDNNEESQNITTQHIESLVESLTVSNNLNSEDDSEQVNPISIPIFNFATSNTSSQNLINLLSNPLCRYASNNTDLHFVNNFDIEEEEEDNENDDDDDEEENDNDSEKEIIKNIHVLPTSLNVEYIPENDNLLSRDNITIIPVVAESNNNSETIAKIDESKITKIKIEVDYDHICKAISATSPILQTSSNQTPSTSTFIGKHFNENQNCMIKSAPSTPIRKIPTTSTSNSTPLHEKRKLSLREQQCNTLRHEINTEIRFKLRKKDCVDAIAFASFEDTLYIAGFKPNPQLYVFHIGDQLLAINNIANIKSIADAHKFIKMCAGLFVEVTIKRLPFAGIYIIKRDFENQCLGLIRDGPSLLDIIPNSVASRSGIPIRPFKSQNDDSIFWIITEINFRPLSMISHKKYDETELLLNNAVGVETSLLLQPSDFIAKIKKELKAMKNYRDYTLQ